MRRQTTAQVIGGPHDGLEVRVSGRAVMFHDWTGWRYEVPWSMSGDGTLRLVWADGEDRSLNGTHPD